MDIPKYDELLIPVLNAIKKLGGSASIEELVSNVVDDLKLSEDTVNKPHSEKDSRTELEYRLAWARTYLKKYGLLTNSSRGVWALTQKGQEIQKINPQEIIKLVNSQEKPIKKIKKTDESPILTIENQNDVEEWRDEVFKALTEMKSDAFERLCQRLLREAGFIQVNITGRSGDGGIDGVGIIRLGLLSFRIVFQCKKYQGSVSSPIVRNFRGAMTGRADKGLIITTGSFTRDAIQEANRDGAPSIDLIDGDRLIDLLKEYNLGINILNVEDVKVDIEWFSKI